MSMNEQENIAALIADRTQPPPSPGRMLELLRAKPYLSTVAMAWLRRTADEGMLYDAHARRRIALIAALATPGDTQRRFETADLAAGTETDAEFYPPQEAPSTPDTEAAIDTFLEKYSTADQNKETEVLEQIIFNPVADYAATLADEEEHSMPEADDAPAGSPEAMINSFIRRHKEVDSDEPRQPVDVAAQPVSTPRPVPTLQKAAKPKSAPEDVTLSESLAKIYIKKKDFARAYEIINNLNLNYPQKNIYFAVQLRFLEKLMLNSELKEKKTRQQTTNLDT